MAEYEIIKELGEGGFGKVVLARNQKTQAKVAIKFFKNESSRNELLFFINLYFLFFFDKTGNGFNIDMIFDEINALKAMNHENIVKVLECFTLPDMTAALVMEYLEGGELR